MSRWTVGVVVAGLLASSGCAVSPMTSPPDVVAVSGRGSVTVTPDTALAQVGVEAHAPRLTDAVADSTQRMTSVLESARALGIGDRDVSTVRYAIDPIAAPRRGEGDAVRIDGYRVTNVVQLRIHDLQTVGRILDAVVRAGANVISSFTLTVSDRGPAEAKARALAVQDAATKAQQLVGAAGLRLGPLLSLSEGVTSRPPASPLARGALMGVMASVPIESGELEISVAVEAHYAIAR